LLAYLALSQPGDFQRRDTLLALFWPELDQAHGRAALSQALTFLRRNLGEGILVTRGTEEVGVDPQRVQSDVGAFQDALAHEEWGRAAELYQGDLLQGMHVPGASPFIDWIDRERERLREAAGGAAWKRAHELLAKGAPTDAERMAQQALDLVPTDESEVQRFIEALAEAGDRAAALRFYEKFAGILARELEVEPAPETVAAMEAARSRTEPASLPEPGGHDLRSPEIGSDTGATEEDDVAPPGTSTPGPLPRTVQPGHSWSRSRRALSFAASLLAVVVLVTLMVRMSSSREAGAAQPPVPRVAVLSFTPVGEDSARTSLAEGVTDQLTTSLAGIQGLRVIPAPPYSEDRPLADIGSELDADLLVRGSVLVMKDKARITTQLFKPPTDHPVWSKTYDGDLSDVLPFLARVARSIAGQVEVVLTREDARQLATVPTTSPQVMNAVLRARMLVERETPESIRQAIVLLNQALNLDPSFAPAWGLLSHAELLKVGWFTESGSGREVIPKVEQAARRALALDPDDVQARIGMAGVYELRGQWELAVRTYRAILTEDPSCSVAGVYLANVLTWMGRYEEAEAVAREMVELDPLWGTAHFELLNVLWESRRYDQALAHLRGALAMDPENPNFRALTAAALTLSGRCGGPGSLLPEEWGIGAPVDEIERLLRLSEAPGSWLLSTAVWVFADCGRQDRALNVYRTMEEMAETTYVSPLERARARVAAGDMDGVLDLLEEGLHQQGAEVRTLTNGEAFNALRDSLRGDPRFEVIVDRIGLPRSHLKWAPEETPDGRS
ncbi:MAG: BTAD domain-containing putative transcriptional regulator, partial [Gemmatimonadota bacterium]